MTNSVSVSPQCRALSDIASEIAVQDKIMKVSADAIVAAMQKREALVVCLKQLAKELR